MSMKQKAILLVSLFCAAVPALAQLQVTPGAQNRFSVPVGQGHINGSRGYYVDVPAGATRLEVRLAVFGCDTDVSLYVRLGVDISADANGNAQLWDFQGSGPTTANKIIVINSVSSPFPLQPGRYFIAYQSNSPDATANGFINVLIDSQSGHNPDSKLLGLAGPATPFEFGCLDQQFFNGLFNGKYSYQVVAPPGTASIKVQVSVSVGGAEVDIYARNGADIAKTSQADFFNTDASSNKTLTITPVSAQGAVYYIDLRVPMNGGVITGTISATVLLINPVVIGTLPTSLTFNSQVGSTPGAQSFTVQNTGGGTLNFSLSKTQPWLTLSQTQGSSTGGAPVTITVSINTTGLTAGSYADDIKVTDQGSPPAATATVHVALNISNLPSPSIGVNPSGGLAFITPVGSNPASQTFTVQNTGGGTLNFLIANSQPWLIVSPSQGTSSGALVTITVSVNTAGLLQATYSDDIRITDQGSNPASPATIHVTLTVTNSSTPAAVVSASTLSFTAQSGTNPPSQPFTVQNGGGGTLVYQIATTQSWLSVFPAQGSSTGSPISHTASVNTGGLVAGNYTAEIRISQNTGSALSRALSGPAPQAGPVVITVKLTVTSLIPGNAPVINAIVNAASSLNAALPGGSIARGSIFSLYGVGVGPATLAQATTFPIPPSLGGASVTITSGSTPISAFLLAATANQINAIMPSNTPLGSASVTVAYNGQTSAAFTINVVNSSFGMFTANQSGSGPAIVQNFNSQSDQPTNSTVRAAKPGQAVVLWGTGLGPITSADALQPPVGGLPVSAQVFLGNKAVSNVFYTGRSPQFAGVDQINFTIPSDAPLGCYVPLLVQVSGVPSNAATMAISADGKPCSDPANPASALATKSGKVGVIALRRLAMHIQSIPGQPAADVTSDTGAAAFAVEAGGEFGFDSSLSLPPPGTCTAYAFNNATQTALLNGQIPSLVPGGRALVAGPQLTVTGPNGSQPISQASGGSYFSILGGSIPAPGQPSTPVFLDPGFYSVNGQGGQDIGIFAANLTVAAPISWTNRDAAAQVDRSQGVTVSWTGGGGGAFPAVLIEGGNLDTQANSAAVFECVVPLSAGSFTVPPSVLSSIPASNGQQTFGFVFVGAAPSGATFTASGIDAGAIFSLGLTGTTVTYK